MTAAPFSLAAAEQLLGPAVMEAIEKSVAGAPPLSAERREQLRAVFASTRHRHTPDSRVPASRAA